MHHKQLKLSAVFLLGLSLTGLQAQKYSTFTDPRDGNVYKTVTIGSQVWMAENLAYLPSVVGPGTGSLANPYYYVYDYNGTSVTEAKATTNFQTYGVLYNWYAALEACPTGWHLPYDSEWKQLSDYLGFTALPGGLRFSGGDFVRIGQYGYWWSATTNGDTYGAYYRGMFYDHSSAFRDSNTKDLGFSVRCLRD